MPTPEVAPSHQQAVSGRQVSVRPGSVRRKSSGVPARTPPPPATRAGKLLPLSNSSHRNSSLPPSLSLEAFVFPNDIITQEAQRRLEPGSYLTRLLLCRNVACYIS